MSNETKKPASKRGKGRTARGEARGRKVNVLTDEDSRKLMEAIRAEMVHAIADKLIDELMARYDVANAAGERDPRFVVFDGWSGIAEAIGRPRDRPTYSLIEEALHAGSRTGWEGPESSGIGLWTYSVIHRAPDRGQPEVLTVILGDALTTARPRKAAAVEPMKSRRDP